VRLADTLGRYAKEFDLAVKTAGGILDNYFSILSPLEPEMTVQTSQFAGQWLQRLPAPPSPCKPSRHKGIQYDDSIWMWLSSIVRYGVKP
jgi:hypothetical protein